MKILPSLFGQSENDTVEIKNQDDLNYDLNHNSNGTNMAITILIALIWL